MSTTPAVPADAVHWPIWRRIGFRFLFSYVLLYCFPTPLIAIPGTESIWDAYHDLRRWLGELLDTALLGTGADFWEPSNGSGDQTIDFVMLLSIVVLAALASVIWTAIDRRRTAYPRLSAFLWVFVRWYLGYTMVDYGFAKVLVSQFPAPSAARLATTIGASSPMGLLWTFMGASSAYVIFTGVMEVVGGVLLFWRRTATLGALICAGILTNIVALNVCYDVPVKLFSSHLLVLALYVASPDLRRLLAFFVLDRPIQPREPRRPTRWRRLERILPVARVLLVGVCFYGAIMTTVEIQAKRRSNPDLVAFADTLTVETFTLGGVDDRSLTPDSEQWKALHRGRISRLFIEMRDGRSLGYDTTFDTKARSIAFKPVKDDEAPAPPPPLALTYTWTDPDHVTLEGTFGGRPVKATLVRKPRSAHRLVSRGFRWVNEAPYNR